MAFGGSDGIALLPIISIGVASMTSPVRKKGMSPGRGGSWRRRQGLIRWWRPPRVWFYLPQTMFLCDSRHEGFEECIPIRPSKSGLVSKWWSKDRSSGQCLQGHHSTVPIFKPKDAFPKAALLKQDQEAIIIKVKPQLQAFKIYHMHHHYESKSIQDNF